MIPVRNTSVILYAVKDLVLSAPWLEILRSATNDEIHKHLSFRACHGISSHGALRLKILSQAQDDRR